MDSLELADYDENYSSLNWVKTMVGWTELVKMVDDWWSDLVKSVDENKKIASNEDWSWILSPSILQSNSVRDDC